MNAAVRGTGLLAVLSLAIAFAAPTAIAGQVRPYAEGAMGIQLGQPAADAQRVGAVLQAVVVASDRFNSFGFVGAQVGDKVSVTVLEVGQKWSVTNLRTGMVQTVGLVNQKLAVVPAGSANQQIANAPAGPVNQQLGAVPTAPANQKLAVVPTPSSTASLTAAPIIASAAADGADVVVAWWGVKGAETFEVFRTADFAQPATRLAQLSNTSLGYRDKGAGAGPFYYQVVAVGAHGTRMASAWFRFPALKHPSSPLTGPVPPPSS